MKWLIIIIFHLFIKTIASQEPVNFSFWNKKLNPTFSIEEKNYCFISYENKFLLKEWNNKIFVLDKKIKKGRINFLIAQRGNYNFSSNKTAISYAQKMSPNLILGFSLEYTFFQQSEIKDNPKLLSPNFGVTYDYSEENSFYCSLYNSGIIIHNKGLPNNLLVFWNHKINNYSSLSTGCVTQKEIVYTSFLYNYMNSDNIKFTFGVNTSEIPIEFAFSCSFKEMEFLFQNNYHQKLGISNQIGIAYKW